MERHSLNRHQPVLVFTFISILGGLFPPLLAPAVGQEPLGVRVPEGFEVTLFADDDLAHDIYSLTIDSLGRVVVSGAGYVKILLDTNGDGKADTAKTYVDGPRAGAQGMYFVGRDLLCAGEGGLIRYKDRDGDDRADGPPDLFWKIKTGGEHDLHAPRKGPDGWWYVIAGNSSQIDEKYVTLDTSPVKNPQAGVVLRFKPDLSGAEVFADGFRNAYDFDFSESGDLFAFDSDGERDISLPWYLPTRVFHVLPGSHQGWLTRSWKRPDHFFDMPPVVASFGRGSPTGVECYRHTQFPEPYRGALFVLDWTYGRVFAMPLERNGSTWTSQPIEFMTAVGQHGFAPTDVAVGHDGSLYVSVGGRGTRGGVYRIRHQAALPKLKQLEYLPLTGATPEQKLQHCLQAPQPLSSWARRVWEPLVAELTSEPFIKSALDRKRPASERVRSIEILTEKFGGLDGDLIQSLSVDDDPLIRSRAAWSIGRSEPRQPDARDLKPYLEDEDPLVARVAMETLLGAEESSFPQLAETLGKQLAVRDRFVRQTGMRLVSKTDAPTFRAVAAAGFQIDWHAAIPVAAGYAAKVNRVEKYPIDLAVRVLLSNRSTSLKLEAARVLQLGLGDLVPKSSKIPPVYDGYASPVSLGEHADTVALVREMLPKVYPSGEPLLDQELERVMAMIESSDPQLFAQLISQLSADSHPVDDIHRLIVASRMPVARTSTQREILAAALVNLEVKIDRLKLVQDSNWADRTLEMYAGLVQKDPELPAAVLDAPGFGLPGHVSFISEMPPERFEDAIAIYSKRVHANPDYVWNSEVLLLLAESLDPEDQALVRSKFDDFSLRSAVVLALSNDPQEADRSYFYRALESASTDVMLECIAALGLLDPSAEAEENVALVRALRRLEPTGEERQARDQIVELLRRNLDLQFGYRFGQQGAPQTEVITAWTNAVQQRFPEVYAAQAGEDGQGLDELKARLAGIDWTHGDAAVGEQLFQTRACIQCHGGRRALGPDLSGAAGRFSRDDLFTAIVYPSRDVSPRYQTTQIVTVNGQVMTGLIVYESVDGMVLRDSNNRTYRIETRDIEFRRQLNQSLMPDGLLRGLSDEDLAHLYAYMQQLGHRNTAGFPREAE